VGPALGAKGVKSMDFCKEFNARTAHIEPGLSIPTKIDIYADRSFSFITRTPTTSYFIKKAAGIEQGSGKPGQGHIGTISLKHIYEIAKIKQADESMRDVPLESICRAVISSAKTVGVKVVP
jgi:large subunit ribosomal protein L11